MSLTLLAHAPSGDESLIQHENGLPYYYYKLGTVDNYELVTNPDEFLVPQYWVTNYEISGNRFDTIQDVKWFLDGFVTGGEAVATNG